MQKYNTLLGAEKLKKNTSLIIVGVVTGILSGLFGGGGGMVVVPAITSVLSLQEKQAHATAIAIILPVTIISSIVYLIRGVSIGVEYPYVQAGVIVGGIVGALLLSKLSNKLISIIFYGIMIFAGVKMII